MDITMPHMEGMRRPKKNRAEESRGAGLMVFPWEYQENIVAALQRAHGILCRSPVKPEVLYEVIKYVAG